MQIKKTSISRLDNVDFTKLKFGSVFSDHMLVCQYDNNQWGSPEIVPYGPISMNPGTQVLHYGQSVFEGMKVFRSINDEILFFRKEENFARLNKSAERMSIPLIDEEVFMSGLNQLINLDRDWCKGGEGYSLYVRPFIFASSECIKASSSDQYTFIIITSPTTTYYRDDINVVIEDNYTRAAKGGVGYAKAAGNYAASFFPTKQANAKGFTQVIWTDAKEHKYIEESGTMNIFFRINNTLITPSLTDSILKGVTRDSIIKLARDMGIDVQERKILVSEITEAYEKGYLEEAFGTGTAVTVAPISSITFNGKKMILPIDQENIYSLKLKKQLQAIQTGKIDDKYNWTSKVIDI
tara:strand:+ start:536 stop:1591 length:1056 start_codon:yes stop_codon:yes gene_type:complete